MTAVSEVSIRPLSQVMEEEISLNPEKLDITIARKVYDENLLASAHGRPGYDESGDKKQYLSSLREKLASCSCSASGFCSLLVGLAPILRWLPKYNVKNDLTADITGGVTVGIMHIPQGNVKKYIEM